MPIVDGLTSTKMIRSYEKTHTNVYSPRAALCGRVPIIAVSASLIERDRQQYIDAGFDAWILKPISFDRLKKLMAAVVDEGIRKECLYQPGAWVKGGWFHLGQKSSDEASTKPSGRVPTSLPSQDVQEAAPDGPLASEAQTDDTIPDEQARLLHAQEEEREKLQEEEKGEEPPS